MSSILIKNVNLVNEGLIVKKHVFIKDQFIKQVLELSELLPQADQVIEAEGLHLFPGLIDDQVHFREPGLTHKANIHSESAAAAAGGITSFMEMPNTNPQTVTQQLLEEKYLLGAQSSVVNYSFFMGVTNDNLEEVLKTNPENVCGVKVFMGSSTGNMLVDNKHTLNLLFRDCKLLIAAHCEDEATIRENVEKARSQYGEDVPVSMHPVIRDVEACYRSSSMAAELAAKHDTRLHILHISTAKEISLFSNQLPLKDKRLTAEACIHHLWFTDADYATKGNSIKWNPAVKSMADRDAVLQAVLDNKIDVIATDHAPHTLEEKAQSYFKAPSGGPLVQHALVALLDLYHQGKISLEKIAEKTAHSVAEMFQIRQRGYIREGYYADLVLVDLNKPTEVKKELLLYKCGWSPFEGHVFRSAVHSTLVNGKVVYSNGEVNTSNRGMRLQFNR